MDRKRTTKEEKFKFFLELHHEFIHHPFHQRQDHTHPTYCQPWTQNAVEQIFVDHPEKKRTFFRYTTRKGKSNMMLFRLIRMYETIQYMILE